MLQKLLIENVALIERLEIDFAAGFNVLSGETGAGKSIMIDAVNFVLGERTSRELIRHGAQKTRVEAVFDIANCSAAKKVLEEQGIEWEDDTLLLSRELNTAGKNICRINGTLVSVAMLKSVSDTLVDIHGQHEHQSLLLPGNHIGFLDVYAHDAVKTVKAEVEAASEAFHALRKERLSGFGSVAERERQIDIYNYQINEIEAAALLENEEEFLLAERVLLANAEKIMFAVENAYEALHGENGAVSASDSAKSSMASIADYAPEYAEAAQTLSDAYYALEDAAYAIRDMRGRLEFDPQRLDAIERRLELLSDLKRKYGSTIPDVLRFAADAKKKRSQLLDAEQRAAKLDELLAKAKGQYLSVAEQLSKLRKEAAASLGREVLAQLADLGMQKADFSVAFLPSEEGEGLPQPNGIDNVEFLLSANPGEPLKPLAKVASGGELSRIMLGFKAIFASHDGIGTLIFDEIDTGISGRIAGTVGEKMVRIADERQVICVTHLPQIASLADNHFLVEKTDDGTATHVSIRALDLEGKYRRIAQMMDGSDESELALEHAKKLVDSAETTKRERRLKV